MADTKPTLKPLVYWAQNASSVFLRVDLHDVKKDNVQIRFHEKGVEFSADAVGAQGLNRYAFEMNVYGTINVEKSGHSVTERAIEFLLAKSSTAWWPRLTDEVIKLPWLKIDFSRWQDPNASSSEDEAPNRNMMDPSMMRQMDGTDYDMSPGNSLRKLLDKTKNPIQDFAGNVLGIDDAVAMAKSYRDKVREWYLFFYNLALFIGYFVIVVELIHGFVVMDKKYFEHCWHRVSPKLKCCVLLQFFECLHALVGFTKTNPMASLVQTGGRATVLFVVLGGEPRMWDKPMVFYVFLVWSLVEIFRYPYYALSCKKMEWAWVTWLRYSMWIPLYPLGFLCEGTILIRSVPLYQETLRFSIQLPNRANFGFDFATFVTAFLLLGFAPTIIFLIGTMRQQRKVKLRKQHVETMKKHQ